MLRFRLVPFCLLLAMSLITSLPLPKAQAQDPAQAETSAVPRRLNTCRFSSFTQLEPNGGNWKTWVIANPRDFVPGAPPYAPEEIAELIQLQHNVDSAARANVAYWNAGGPSYRWNEILMAQAGRSATNAVRIGRNQALLNVAIYDALVAAWYAKYLHERPRPGECTSLSDDVNPHSAEPVISKCLCGCCRSGIDGACLSLSD